MGAADVYRVMGDPERSLYGGPHAHIYAWDSRGISLQISDPGFVRRNDPGGVTEITVTGGSWATAEGIAVGASELRVQAMLGKPTAVEHPRPGPPLTLYKYRDRLMWIYVDGNSGTVSGIRLWKYW